MMSQTPFGDDGTATGNDTRHAVGRHRNVAQQETGMNREVIDTLFSLFDQRILINFPCQIFSDTVDFFQCLIHRNGSDRYR